MAAVYDADNNPVAITEGLSGPTGQRVTTKSYDDFDRLVGMTDPDGKAVAAFRAGDRAR